MLTPITSHERQAHEGERDQENKNGRPSVNVFEQEVQESIVAKLACGSLESHRGLARAEEVAR